MQFIDDNVAFLEAVVVRNFERWPVIGIYVWPNDFVGESYEQEVGFLKSWLTQRLDWMDDNMIGDCDLVDSNEETIVSILRPKVYPNPVESLLSIELHGEDFQEVSLELYDLLGNLIKFYTLTKPLTTIEVGDIPKGMYFYRINTENLQIGAGKIGVSR